MPNPRPVGNGRRPGNPMTRPLKPGGKKPSIGRKPANKKPGRGPVATKKPARGIGNSPDRITHPTLPKKGGRPLDRAPRDPSRGASSRRNPRVQTAMNRLKKRAR